MPEYHLFSKILIFAIPLIFAITIHEAAHGYVANYYGDSTAKLAGRLSLNPLRHIDLIGTIILPLIMITFGGFIFGWAKPVPVNENNLRNGVRDMALVAIAGPVVNFIMAIFWAGILHWHNLFIHNIDYIGIISTMAKFGIIINIVLMCLNLLPIPPLDGSRIVNAFLPKKISYWYYQLEPYGIIILIILLISNILNMILSPFILYFYNLINSIYI